MSKTTDAQRAKPTGDVVLQEIWRIKGTLSASYGHDVKRLFAETRKREKLSGHPLVEPPKRRKACCWRALIPACEMTPGPGQCHWEGKSTSASVHKYAMNFEVETSNLKSRQQTSANTPPNQRVARERSREFGGRK